MLRPWSLPEPLLPVAIEPHTKSDEDKLSQALGRIAAEDPSLRIDNDAETHQLVLWAMGEAHAEVTLERLAERYGVHVDQVPFVVSLRETFAGTGHRPRAARQAVRRPRPVRRLRRDRRAAARGQRLRVRRQGGRRRRAAPVHPQRREGRPRADGSAGYATATRSSTSGSRSPTARPTASTPPTWPSRPPGALALREAAAATSVTMLEPFDAGRRARPRRPGRQRDERPVVARARVLGTDKVGDDRTLVTAEVPQTELVRYAIDLRSATHGAGTFTRSFAHYEPMPEDVARTLEPRAPLSAKSALARRHRHRVGALPIRLSPGPTRAATPSATATRRDMRQKRRLSDYSARRKASRIGPAVLEPDSPVSHEDGDGEVVLGADHPGVGAQRRRRRRTRRCRSWRSPGRRGRRRAPPRCREVTTPRSISRSWPTSPDPSAGTSGLLDLVVDAPATGARSCPTAPRRSRSPSPSARRAPCPARSCRPPPRSPDCAGGTCPKYDGKPRSWSTPRPSEAAASARSPRPSRSRSSMKAVLQELATAVRSGMRPEPAGGVVVVVLELLAVDHGRGGALDRRVRVEAGAQQRQRADRLEGRPRRELAVRRHVVAVGPGPVGGGHDLAGRGPDRDQRARRSDAARAAARRSAAAAESRVSRSGRPAHRLLAEQLALLVVGGDRDDAHARRAGELLVVAQPAARRARPRSPAW